MLIDFTLSASSSFIRNLFTINHDYQNKKAGDFDFKSAHEKLFNPLYDKTISSLQSLLSSRNQKFDSIKYFIESFFKEGANTSIELRDELSYSSFDDYENIITIWAYWISVIFSLEECFFCDGRFKPIVTKKKKLHYEALIRLLNYKRDKGNDQIKKDNWTWSITKEIRQYSDSANLYIKNSNLDFFLMDDGSDLICYWEPINKVDFQSREDLFIRLSHCLVFCESMMDYFVKISKTMWGQLRSDKIEEIFDPEIFNGLHDLNKKYFPIFKQDGTQQALIQWRLDLSDMHESKDLKCAIEKNADLAKKAIKSRTKERNKPTSEMLQFIESYIEMVVRVYNEIKGHISPETRKGDLIEPLKTSSLQFENRDLIITQIDKALSKSPSYVGKKDNENIGKMLNVLLLKTFNKDVPMNILRKKISKHLYLKKAENL